LHFGLGPIGAAIAKQVADRPGFKIVGAVDTDPAKSGRDLGDVIALGRPLRVRVQADAVSALRSSRPDVVVHCTSSSIQRVIPQLATILKARAAIVSTTEELAYPYYRHARQARQIDAAARKAKVGVVATGVNPGYAMDALPIMLCAACERIDRVTVNRVQDARRRRLPFQLKIGSGLTADEFQQKVRDLSVRHVGMTESIAMIADSLGWKLTRITDEIEPRMATETVSSEFLTVQAGRVCGIVQDGTGYRGDEPVIRLHLEAYLGAPESFVSVDIVGSPPLSMRLAGGIHGDIATASLAINAIPKILAASPGLHTMRDLALPSFFPGRGNAASAGASRRA
jgi:4-hydroxy-tetrahydrodipicolinate reductase